MTQKKYSKGALVALIGFGGFGYSAAMGLGYFNQTYYSLFQEGTGFSDVQIGTLVSIIGILATFGYLFGGVLSDIFKPKFLMCLSHFACGAIGIGMALLPGYNIMLILQVLISIFSIFTYWCAMSKFVRSLGTTKQEGRLYGFFYMGVGIAGTLTGFAATAIINASSTLVGLKALMFMYAGLNLLAGLVIAVLYKNPPDAINEKTGEADSFKMKYVLDVLKMPEIWLLSVAGFVGYLINVATSYFNPLLTSSFGISVAVMTALATIRSYVVRLSINPVSGFVIDKAGGATKMMTVLLVAMFVVLLIVTVMPWTPGLSVVAIILMIALAIIYNFLSPTWFTPLSEIGIPDKMRGTAVGVTNAIIFLSDAFMYTVAGNLIANNEGDTGYRILFAILTASAVVGFVCIVLVRKRIKARKAAVAA